MTDDVQNLRTLIQQQKQEAGDLGLDKAVARVYKDVQYYPGRIEQGNVPSLVTTATEREGATDDYKSITIVDATIAGTNSFSLDLLSSCSSQSTGRDEVTWVESTWLSQQMQMEDRT